VTFTVAYNFGTGVCPAFVPSSPAPWTHTIPAGASVPLTVTLQGLASEAPAVIRVTNAVVLRVN